MPTTAAVAPTTAPAASGNWPSYYPADYAKLVEDSKKESAGLVVYSIMSEKNWSGVVKGFSAKYPWIKLQSMDLGSYEVFERYYSESASNARTAVELPPIASTQSTSSFERSARILYGATPVRLSPPASFRFSKWRRDQAMFLTRSAADCSLPSI